MYYISRPETCQVKRGQKSRGFILEEQYGSGEKK